MSIYFIQPEELIGTNRYKIGCSHSETINRIISYKKGSRVLYSSIVNKPFKLEKIIKEKFKNNFKLIAGKEFFEGNEILMLKLFKELVDNYSIKKITEPTKSTNKSKQSKTLKTNICKNCSPNIKNNIINMIIEYKLKGFTPYTYLEIFNIYILNNPDKYNNTIIYKLRKYILEMYMYIDWQVNNQPEYVTWKIYSDWTELQYYKKI
jgi:hypothetical protein